MSKPTGQPQPPGADLAAQVQRLCQQGKAKQAVELAKQAHKAHPTPETERLLVDAYLARIEQFQQKGAPEDADVLIKLVHDRFPAHRNRLGPLRIKAAAVEGKIEDLVAPLAKPEVSQQVRETIEKAVREQVVDLAGLAAARSLPPEHDLRVAAGAIAKALEAVTTGPVTDEQIALPEVPRRSPLAPWKMLVLGIACYYRNDDESARRALAAIPADAVPHRLVPGLTAILDGKPPTAGLAGALAAKLIEDDGQVLRNALEQVEQAFRDMNLASLLRASRAAISASRDALAERVRQHILVRAEVEDAPVEALRKTVGSPKPDASYWKLRAKGEEARQDAGFAVLYWERFLRHAVDEGLIKLHSPEEAVVWLRMAQNMTSVRNDDLLELREDLADARKDVLAVYKPYPELKHLVPQKPAWEAGYELTDTPKLFEKAIDADPRPEVFRQWWGWAQRIKGRDYEHEAIAERWHQHAPNDPQPLLIMAGLAEERNALTYALKHLTAAEALDPMNPRVRRARLRLTLGMLWRHLKQKKAHLAEKDLTEIYALPSMNEGDRLAFTNALRAATNTLKPDGGEALRAAVAAMIEQLGALASMLVLDAVREEGRLPRIPGTPEEQIAHAAKPEQLIEAAARYLRLVDELNLRSWLPHYWVQTIEKELTKAGQGGRWSSTDLLAIGSFAVGAGLPRLVYAVSAAGLATAVGPTAARFLLLRAKSLWAGASFQRVAQCLRAAQQLARQAHDPELMGQISAEIDQQPYVHDMIARGGGRELGDQVMTDILSAERQASKYPVTYQESEKAVVLIETEGYRARGGGAPTPWDTSPLFDDLDDEGDDYEDEYDEEADDELAARAMDELFGNMPPSAMKELAPILAELIGKHGAIPPGELERREPALVAKLRRLFDKYGKKKSY